MQYLKRKLTKPVVHPEIRKEIPNSQVGPSKTFANVQQGPEYDCQTEVTRSDQFGIFCLIQWTGRVEVVHSSHKSIRFANAATLLLTEVVVVSGDVEVDVHDPPHELLADKCACCRDRSFLHELRKFVDIVARLGGILFTCLGDKDHVPFDMTGGLVVFAVGDLPGEIRNKEDRVTDEADGVIECLGRGEGLMTAFMSEHPQTGTEQSLHKGVYSPQSRTSVHRGNILWGQESVGEDEYGSEYCNVTGHIRQTTDARTLVTMSGDCITDLFDGEVRDLEVVAQCIDHTKILIFGRQSGIKGIHQIHLFGRIDFLARFVHGI